MYIGSAGLMTPIVRNAREQQNGPVSLCSIGAGAVISMGLGALTSKWFGKAVDKVVDFWDDVKPEKNEVSEEEETNG
jgi:hypothetical protein